MKGGSLPHCCRSSGSMFIVGPPAAIDDSTMNAPFDLEDKLSSMNFPRLVMRIASSASRGFCNLLNCRFCDLVRLYAIYFSRDGVRK